MRSFLLFTVFLLIKQSLSIYCPYGKIYENGEWRKGIVELNVVEDRITCVVAFILTGCDFHIYLNYEKDFENTCKYTNGEDKYVDCKCEVENCVPTEEMRKNVLAVDTFEEKCTTAINAVDFTNMPNFLEFFKSVTCDDEIFKLSEGHWERDLRTEHIHTEGKVYACTITFDVKEKRVVMGKSHEYDISKIGKCIDSECFCHRDNCNKNVKEWAGIAQLGEDWNIDELHELVNPPEPEEPSEEEETTTDAPEEPSPSPTMMAVKEETTSSLPENPRSNETTKRSTTSAIRSRTSTAETPSIDENPPPQTNNDGQRFTKVALIVASYLVLAI